MPPICSPLVRPGRPAEAAPVISKALEDVLMRFLLCLAISCVSSPCWHKGWMYYCILLSANRDGVAVDCAIWLLLLVRSSSANNYVTPTRALFEIYSRDSLLACRSHEVRHMIVDVNRLFHIYLPQTVSVNWNLRGVILHFFHCIKFYWLWFFKCKL